MSAKPQKVKRRVLQFDVSDGSSNEAADIHSKLKSEAEIQEFSMPDDLPEVERVSLLLESKNELQRMAGITALPRCVAEVGGAAITTLFKRFAKATLKQEQTQRTEAAAVLTRIIPDVNDPDFIRSTCVPFIEKIIESASGEGGDQPWVDALLACCPAGGPATVHDLAEYAVANADAGQEKVSRMMACRLLGAVYAALDEHHALLPRVLSSVQLLCQDTDRDVRSTICAQLPLIVERADLYTRENVIFRDMLELLQDEEICVKIAALGACIDLMPSMSPNTIWDRIMPCVIRLYRESETAGAAYADLRLSATRQLGPLLARLHSSSPSSSSSSSSSLGSATSFLVDYFKAAAQDSNAAIRRLCAYNMPAVIHGCGRGHYSASIQATLVGLINDPDAVVRCTIAHAFHEIVVLVGRDRSISLLRPCFFKLINDPDLGVQAALVAHVDETAACMFRAEALPGETSSPKKTRARASLQLQQQPETPPATQRDQTLLALDEQILKALLEYDTRLELRWRDREILFRRIGSMCNTLSADVIHSVWTEAMLSAMHSDARPVQLAAAATLVQLMRAQQRWVTRIEICQHIINEFAQSESSRDRLLFLEMCPMLMEHFSRRWFRDRILDVSVGLCNDDVAAVRRKACQLLPDYRRLVIGAMDDRLGVDAIGSPRQMTTPETIMKVIDRLQLDSCRDVQDAAQAALVALKQAAGSSSSDPASDLADQAKEASEEAIFKDDCSSFSPEFFKIARSSSIPHVLLQQTHHDTAASASATRSTPSSPLTAIASKKKSLVQVNVVATVAQNLRAKTKLRRGTLSNATAPTVPLLPISKSMSQPPAGVIASSPETAVAAKAKSATLPSRAGGMPISVPPLKIGAKGQATAASTAGVQLLSPRSKKKP
ncbi:TOG domain-containing protein [Plasmodiophora brassicae]|uniref:TOG domain-containing protein n=1 Tax=Plasmodiophora brassicae TaxID=37360 RepID=A0A0G4J736_PLABS|nr:hypothetical protein PBRA_009367 [Plasmodiophora brassicae]